MVTSFLLSPQTQDPRRTQSMGLSKIFGHSPSSGSTSNSTSSRSRGLDPLKLGPGSSKGDYAIGLAQTTSPTSDLSQSHNIPPTNEPPPPYAPREDRRFNDFAMDSKTQAHKPDVSKPKNSAKGQEDDYRILKDRDIVVVLDDSSSMAITDPHKSEKRSRWQQVSNRSLSSTRPDATADRSNRRFSYPNHRRWMHLRYS